MKKRISKLLSLIICISFILQMIPNVVFAVSMPGVSITTTATSPTSDSPIPVTVTFNSFVTGFVQADVTVGNGTISNFTAVSAKVYTFDVTPTADGAVTVDVAANVVFGGNTAATQLSVTYKTEDSLDNWAVRNPLPTGSSIPPESHFNKITFGNGIYVAVGYDGILNASNTAYGGIIVTSNDGINWERVATSVDDSEFFDITYGNGIFVASYGNGGILTSTDGITWTARSSGVSYRIEDLSYLNNEFIGLCSLYPNIITSTDGITWSLQTIIEPLKEIAYGNGKYVAVGTHYAVNPRTRKWEYYHYSYTSSDLNTWTSQDFGFPSSIFKPLVYDIAYNNGVFVIYSNYGCFTSTDGVTWIEITELEGLNSFSSIQAVNGQFLLTQSDDVFSSTDGSTWEKHENGHDVGINSITYNDGTYTAVGNSGSILQTVSSTPSNAAPTATDVEITGTAAYGEELTGEYTYNDADSDTEGTPTYKWYHSDDASGTNKTEISDADGLTYTVTTDDLGKYLSFEVTPVASTGETTGTAVESSLLEIPVPEISITFNSNDGSDVTAVKQDYNTEVTKPVDPTKTDCTFAGWYFDSELTTAVSWPYSMPAEEWQYQHRRCCTYRRHQLS